ncbi:MAG: histidine phosphatase family protein [Eubacteriales bacterium]|nr:histidine phosphatase family protein [Eubacteriales bacterium]
MKLIIVRHADPDYSIDSLTPTGWKEAELLSEYLCKLDITALYTSPLGRAKDTASLTLKKMNRTATECDWLREFWPKVARPDLNRTAEEVAETTVSAETTASVEATASDGGSDTCDHGNTACAWDWLPADWTKEPRFYDKDAWYTVDVMAAAGVGEAFHQVTDGLDRLLAAHGYVREQGYYRAEKPNRDTIVLFCHFGLEGALLAHLLGVSPMVLWHGTCAAPSSVTTLVTEERREGIAYFRIGSFGSTSHLYVAGEEPSFAARFCETFDCAEERHD